MTGALRKAAQAAAIWAVALALLWLAWPGALALLQLWILVLAGLASNALQPAYRPFEGSRTAEDRGTAVQILWTVYGAQVLAIAELAWRRPALALDELALLSILAMAGGVALRTWAVATLGRWFTWNVQVQPGQRLVTTGVYAWLRHPSYTGALITFTMGCVLLRSWAAAMVALIALPLAFARRIRHEKKVMMDAFPEYAAYRERTGALLPWLPGRHATGRAASPWRCRRVISIFPSTRAGKPGSSEGGNVMKKMIMALAVALAMPAFAGEVRREAKETKHEVKKAAKEAKEEVKDAAKDVGDAVKDATHADRGAKKAARHVKRSGRHVKRDIRRHAD